LRLRYVIDGELLSIIRFPSSTFEYANSGFPTVLQTVGMWTRMPVSACGGAERVATSAWQLDPGAARSQ